MKTVNHFPVNLNIEMTIGFISAIQWIWKASHISSLSAGISANFERKMRKPWLKPISRIMAWKEIEIKLAKYGRDFSAHQDFSIVFSFVCKR